MPGRALGRDLGELRHERLHRDAAHRVADQHRAAQVELLDHRAQVERQVVERVARRAELRLAVTAVVVRDRPETRARELLELVEPRANRVRDAVREHDRRAFSVFDDVDRCAVERVEAAVDVDRARRAPRGVTVGVAPQPGRAEPLPGVAGTRETGRGAGHNPRDLPDRAQPAHASSPAAT